MKKSILVLLVFLTILSGCSLIFPEVENSSQSQDGPSNDYLSEYSDKWCYQRLPATLKSGYGEIYAAVVEGFDNDSTITISDSTLGTQREYTGIRIELSKPLETREDAKLLYTAFLWDNPHFFHIGNTYSYEGYRSGNNDYYNVFCLVYTMSAQPRMVAAGRLKYVVSQIKKDLANAQPSDQFETELFLHDKLAEICSYEAGAAQSDDPAVLYPTAFTAYGALVEGRAVCEGYSRAMQLLLHENGMECTLVNGYDHNGAAHMWNLVTVNGHNYHLDVTWNDSSDRLHHSYFNLSTAEILLSHTIADDNIGVDTCTATDANYYHKTGRQINTVHRDDIAKVIAQAIKNGETSVDMRFTKSSFAGARLFVNNRELLIQMVNEILSDTDYEMWPYEEYSVNEIYYTLTLYKQPD